ncbi:exocyst complex component [Trifolium pratense]|uniref:Exocyst complex component n=1 Tax=Trifolium pratense TaxID=57577 RepID=A0A2K3LI93_TRIPR|nr:exocyst complex component [Trifolium pratense]
MLVSLLVNTNLARLRNKMTSMLNKIVRFVMQPKICRFVCFVSSIVGLLCYALSSSFNHLFGNWNFLKLGRIGPKVFPDSGIWENFDRNTEMSDIKNDLHKTVKKMVDAMEVSGLRK